MLSPGRETASQGAIEGSVAGLVFWPVIAPAAPGLGTPSNCPSPVSDVADPDVEIAVPQIPIGFGGRAIEPCD